jgi:hypothetical protein
MRSLGFSLLLSTSILSPALAAPSAEPIRVLVLGTYHFGNPGLDLHNAKVDDVLAPRRQAELEAVTKELLRFAPTRVAVEVRADDQPGHRLPGYREYASGKGREVRNEIQQIGFRLALAAGHAEAYGIDAPGDFPFEPLQAFAAANGSGDALQQSIDDLGRKTTAFEALQAKSTVGQLLRGMNEPAAIRADHGWYMGALRYGKAAEQPGAKLVAAWSARNLEICARLVQIAQPGDRIVVVYGAGHSFLLRQCVADLPGWELVEANDFLPKGGPPVH